MLSLGPRHYDPEIGRFLMPDLLVPVLSNPQDLNRYSYVRNSPPNLVDPTGLAPACRDSVQGCPSDRRDSGGRRFGSTPFDPGFQLPEGAIFGNPGEAIARSRDFLLAGGPLGGEGTSASQRAPASVDSFEIAGLGPVEEDDCVPTIGGCAKIGFPPAIAPGSSAAGALRAIGSKAISTTSRKGSRAATQLLRRMAKKAGLEVESGGKHLTVRNPETGRLVAQIPNTIKGKGTARDIVEKILSEAGLE